MSVEDNIQALRLGIGSHNMSWRTLQHNLPRKAESDHWGLVQFGVRGERDCFTAPRPVMPPLSRGLRRAASLSLRSSRRQFGSRRDFFKVSEEVQDALQQGKPVVALETTIYTHGMARPHPVCVLLMISRLSLSRERCAILPSRISGPCQWRSTRHHWSP